MSTKALKTISIPDLPSTKTGIVTPGGKGPTIDLDASAKIKTQLQAPKALPKVPTAPPVAGITPGRAVSSSDLSSLTTRKITQADLNTVTARNPNFANNKYTRGLIRGLSDLATATQKGIKSTSRFANANPRTAAAILAAGSLIGYMALTGKSLTEVATELAVGAGELATVAASELGGVIGEVSENLGITDFLSKYWFILVIVGGLVGLMILFGVLKYIGIV